MFVGGLDGVQMFVCLQNILVWVVGFQQQFRAASGLLQFSLTVVLAPEQSLLVTFAPFTDLNLSIV